MIWVVVLLFGTAAVLGVGANRVGPRVPRERIAEADEALVTDADRAAWRSMRVRSYDAWKREDDFYRVAAYKKAIASGMSAADAKAKVKKDFPIYYLDPASRDEGADVGDDAALPIVLRERVNKRAGVLKAVMAEHPDQFPTMNALVRDLVRKGSL